MRQGTALSAHVYEGQEAVKPQFFIAIEDNSDIGNQAAPSGKERPLVVQILPLDMPVGQILFCVMSFSIVRSISRSYQQS